MSKKKIKNLDRFHYHEALDRAYLCADILENTLIAHPVIKKHKELRKKINKAQQLIMDAYQIIGGLKIINF
jgi:cell fate (sporulation/competence/biofilm development) regulator YmcA (YheA/YmcA/DUF963 family)